MNKSQILVYLSILHNGDWEKIYESIVSGKYELKNKEALQKLYSMKSKAITILDPEYPKYFYQIPRPPFVLFYYGDISLIRDHEKNISIVGSRNNTVHGAKITEEISSNLAPNYRIVSGLAKGIDAIAHEACLNAGGHTIAVLGNGIDFCYPPENFELYERIKSDPESLIISEYYGMTISDPAYFPERNRLIAGLSDFTIITEAFQRSGTSITAGYCLCMGRDVLAVPTNGFNSSLCNQLIRQGCIPVDSLDDIYDEIGFVKIY